MGIVALPSFGSDPATITASGLDGKVDPLATEFNGSIDNDNIKASAGIVYSKLSLTGGIVYADLAGTALSAITQTVGMSGKSINFAKGSDIASATTTDIGAATGNYVHVTGTTTITGLGTVQAGTTRFVRFTGALILTHNATSLILPTAANITTVADDEAIFVSLGSGNWKCANYQRKDGTALVGTTATVTNALSGSVIQTVTATSSTMVDVNDVYTADGNPPQYSEGDTIISAAITPNNASNKLEVIFDAWGTRSTSMVFHYWLNNSTGAGDAAVLAKSVDQTAGSTGINLYYTVAAGGTSEITFTVKGACSTAGSFYVLGAAGGTDQHGAASNIYMTIREIKA